MLRLMVAVLLGAGVGEETSVSLTEIMAQSDRIRELRTACGPLSLTRCSHLLGNPIPYKEVLSLLPEMTSEGVALADLVEASSSVHVDSRLLKVADPKTLAIPAILLVDEGRHCVVLEEGYRDDDTWTIWDPGTLQRQTWSSQRLRNNWTGHAVVFSTLSLPAWMSWCIAFLTIANGTIVSLLLFNLVRARKKL